jgi:hypothetical protein
MSQDNNNIGKSQCGQILRDKTATLLSDNLNEGDHFQDLGTHGRIKSKWI